jgi:branched-chain amino acid transport system substrate-binding protein
MRRALLVLAIGFLMISGMSGSENVYAQAKKKPIKLGMVADKTGANAAYGYSHEKVVRAAVAKINKEGGIMGRPLELYVEDTESKAPVGALKFRKLAETYGVDFVIDSNNSGVAIACSPVAKELKVPYFPSASATELSGEKGNRYVFPACTSVREEAKGVAKWAVRNLGKKWVTVVVNFAWGWSNEQDFKNYIAENGGTVEESIRVPIGTSDWLRYLSGKIPKDADAVYFACFGSDFLSFIRDLHAVRPDIKKLGAVYCFSAQDIKAVGTPVEGAYCLTSYPTTLEGLNTKANKTYRELIGVDPEGKEIGTGTRFVLAYNWAMWQSVFALKAAMEKVGWKGREDTPNVIKALEGTQFKEGVEFPQGDMRFRPQDHLALAGLYVERVVNGELKVVAKIPVADAVYPPMADHTKEPF